MRSKLIEVSGFIPCLRNSASFSVHNPSLQKMYNVRCCSSICVCGWQFPDFVIQNLRVCSVGLLEEMCSVGCFRSICVGGAVFLAFVIQNLWVCIVALLQECATRNVQHRLLHQCMCGGLCVSCLRNSESDGVLSSLAERKVQHRLLHQLCVGYLFPAFVI